MSPNSNNPPKRNLFIQVGAVILIILFLLWYLL